eukprot:5838014-Amphidinium_carterae.1
MSGRGKGFEMERRGQVRVLKEIIVRLFNDSVTMRLLRGPDQWVVVKHLLVQWLRRELIRLRHQI